MPETETPRYRNYEHYITEGWAKEPKHTFRRVGEAARELAAEPGFETARVLDIGCATGELIFYLRSLFPAWSFTGLDLFDPLIEEARTNVPDATFLTQDVLTLDSSLDGTFDLICAVGVLSLFEDEDAETFWEKAHALLRPGGAIIVLGPLNEFGVDMMLRHRKWMHGKRGPWERGWSIPSRQSVEQSIGRLFANHTVEPYAPQLDLEPKDDPIRTWTVPYGDAERQLTNGLKLLVNYNLIVARA